MGHNHNRTVVWNLLWTVVGAHATYNALLAPGFRQRPLAVSIALDAYLFASRRYETACYALTTTANIEE